MKLQSDTFGNLSVKVFLPEQRIKTVVYFHDAIECAVPEDILESQAAACVLITGEDWNHDLTPWPAERVFRDGEDFRGNAGNYLETLRNHVIPGIERKLRLMPEHRILAGVSLAGLFAVYAVYQTDLFDGIASISGSLWYDGFIEYMEGHSAAASLKSAYFSVGDKEKRTGNRRMARVELCMTEAAEHLKEQGVHTMVERNPGNHFVDGEKRIRKAISWLLENI